MSQIKIPKGRPCLALLRDDDYTMYRNGQWFPPSNNTNCRYPPHCKQTREERQMYLDLANSSKLYRLPDGRCKLLHPCCSGAPMFCAGDMPGACNGLGSLKSCDPAMGNKLAAQRLRYANYSVGGVAKGAVDHIAFAVEGHFYTGTLAAVASIIDHCSAPSRLHIHIFSDCRSFLMLLRLAKKFWCSLDTHGAQLTLHEVDPIRFHLTRHGFGCPGSCAAGIFANYVRFYLPMLLDVGQVLWVDADGLVFGDVNGLMQSTFTGPYAEYSLAAVLRPDKTLKKATGLNRKALTRLGLHGVCKEASTCNAPTLNAGLVALNLQMWRSKNVTGRLETLISRMSKLKLDGFSGMSTGADSQTPMEALLLNSTPIDIQPIDPSWNVEGLGWKRIPPETLCTGRFLHWSGPLKPWGTHRLSRYHDLWQPYADRVLRRVADANNRLEHCHSRLMVERSATCQEAFITKQDMVASKGEALEKEVGALKNRQKKTKEFNQKIYAKTKQFNLKIYHLKRNFTKALSKQNQAHNKALHSAMAQIEVLSKQHRAHNEALHSDMAQIQRNRSHLQLLTAGAVAIIVVFVCFHAWRAAYP